MLCQGFLCTSLLKLLLCVSYLHCFCFCQPSFSFLRLWIIPDPSVLSTPGCLGSVSHLTSRMDLWTAPLPRQRPPLSVSGCPESSRMKEQLPWFILWHHLPMLAGLGCPVPEPGPVRQQGLRGGSQGQRPLQKPLYTVGQWRAGGQEVQEAREGVVRGGLWEGGKVGCTLTPWPLPSLGLPCSSRQVLCDKTLPFSAFPVELLSNKTQQHVVFS